MSGAITPAAPLQGPPAYNAPLTAPLSVRPPTNPYVTPDQFRIDKPAFADATTYPDGTVQYFLDLSGVMINPSRWGQMTVEGMELITAHFLTLQRYAFLKAGGGAGAAAGVPGLSGGLVSSKSVSKVSVSYDQSSTAIEGGGPWNYTVFGQQFLQWAMMAGTGGYETLAVASDGMVGTVHTWARGVMIGWAGI
jgi:Protein of unknown function (DUF4054)